MSNKQTDDHNIQDPACSCPSGDGSLRWPCPAHPPKSNFAFMTGDRDALRPDLGDRRFHALELGTPAAVDLVDVMIDTETLGTKPGSAILSIGAVMFGPTGLGEEFYAPILLQSCTAAGLTIDPNTIAWWMQQSDAARAAAFRDDAEALAVVLYRFTMWLTERRAEKAWCHGATFDVPLLEAAYQACGMTPPWKFWNVRDTRTLYDLVGVKVDRSQDTHHNALDDARAQAEAAVVALQRLQGSLARQAACTGNAAGKEYSA